MNLLLRDLISPDYIDMMIDLNTVDTMAQVQSGRLQDLPYSEPQLPGLPIEGLPVGYKYTVSRRT